MWTLVMLVTLASLRKVIELSVGWVSTRKVKWKPWLTFYVSSFPESFFSVEMTLFYCFVIKEALGRFDKMLKVKSEMNVQMWVCSALLSCTIMPQVQKNSNTEMVYHHFEMFRRQGQCFINLSLSQMASISKSVLGTLDYRHRKMKKMVMISFKRRLRFGEYDESQLQLEHFSSEYFFKGVQCQNQKRWQGYVVYYYT